MLPSRLDETTDSANTARQQGGTTRMENIQHRLAHQCRNRIVGFVMRPRTVLTAALLATGATGAKPADAALPCAMFAGSQLPNWTITTAEPIAAGSYTAPDGQIFKDLPAFCRIAATLTPSVDSAIKVEVWLPQSGWNGRFNGTGNGGYAGTISYGALAGGLRLGFATANTDMGTAPSTGLDGKPLVGHPERWIDWGYRSTHLMTTASKQIIKAFYGRKPDYSYFSGCSTGGGQALHEAEQFPEDYDGILGGAPAENRTHLHAEILWSYAVTHRTADSLIPPDKAKLVTNAVVAACGTRSGSLPSDSFLTEPRACRWDPTELLCQQGGDASSCLNQAQVDTLQLLYDGPRNPRTGHLIYPGIPRGSESGSTFDLPALEGISIPSAEPQFDGLFYWAFGANWNWRTFDFARDMAQTDQVLARFLNANSLDLSRFEEHGGKLLMYHGWADALVPAQDLVDYYLRVAGRQEHDSQAQDLQGDAYSQIADGATRQVYSLNNASPTALNRTRQFFRLFMVPGMGHCGGGPGPNQFGNSSLSPIPADPQHNALLALQRWVEEGDAPQRIIATKFVNDVQSQGVALTRPLCMFPRIARYKGAGSTTDASSFECGPPVADAVHNNPVVAPEYLR